MLGCYPKKFALEGGRFRKFHTIVSYQTLDSENSLADLWESINLMPHSLFRKLGISKLKPTKISIQLTDQSIKYLVGVSGNLDEVRSHPHNFGEAGVSKDMSGPELLASS
ncbi:hypothetical protein Tco_1205133 [Tanacetum coccineum]